MKLRCRPRCITIRPGNPYFVYTSVTFCLPCVEDDAEVTREWMWGNPVGLEQEGVR